MTAPVLRVSGLQVNYGGNTALSIESFHVGKGELVGVVGANGAGKSTLVNGVLGWSRGPAQARGDIFLDGENLSKLPTHERVRKGLLLIPESKLVFGNLTVQDNLQAASRGGVATDRRRYSVEEVYGLFPSLDKRKNSLGAQLSGGERQMLGIARALCLGPRVLLLDEPSIGLAPLLISKMLHTIRSLVDEGLSVLLVEQNVRAALQVVDRLVLLERGSIVADGPVDQMRGDPRIIDAYLGKQAK